ncbi:thrombospondin type-1 domain-containing protein 7B-like [Brachyhypopomus gauderio]|uniref:thrombospondin type-1 domain-containing protein 7B-like n=1 Tax=Brachyhypopomus gauderio TaxID=698409 RepID=UPI0040429EDD
MSVNDSLCDPDDMPTQVQTCVLPCPDDCVMSPWSHWSLCPTSCDPSAVRTRTRHMLRPPAGDAVCPESNQTESCVANSNCITYQYNVSDWSTCRLDENAVCGVGVRTRLLDCVRGDGRLVSISMCEELGLPQPERLVDTCQVDCPISCVLSEWSAWTECSHTCGNQGVMLRSRRVLQEAEEEGRPCASQLSQTKPCPIRPCYSWLLGDWSPCLVEGADCGEGVRGRNLSCVVHWGHWPDAPGPPITVEEEQCGERLQRESEQELQQPCFLPCPGDCHLTEWSSWSSCQLTCLEGRSFEAVGQQARSQAVIIQAVENQESCPQQVFETRPCKGGKCHSYEWRTSTWNNNERLVWCQRSDGVNVTGGCFTATRPAAIRHCHPPCTKPFSQCKQSGVCGCERGYTEVMTTHGFLDYCTKTPGGDNRKADVKTSSGRLKPGPSHIQDFFSEWPLHALSPDGRIKMWVYGATAGGFVLILFIVAVSFLLCSRPAKQSKNLSPPQKALALAYDGDVDM